VGLEQSSAIKTGHESGSREGGERGGKRASGGLMHSNLLACFQSGMRILEPRFRFFTPLSACGINSQISRDFTPADAVKNEWVYVVPKCRMIVHCRVCGAVLKSRDLELRAKYDLSLKFSQLPNRNRGSEIVKQKCASVIYRTFCVYFVDTENSFVCCN